MMLIHQIFWEVIKRLPKVKESMLTIGLRIEKEKKMTIMSHWQALVEKIV